MANNKIWKNIFKKYLASDWINKPSIFSQEVVRYFKGKKLLLDLGAGLGQDSRFFSQKGFQVTSADISSYALSLAKEKFKPENIKYLKLDLSAKLPFKDKSFDVVYSHLALHYFDFKTTKKIFQEIHRVLKDDGIFAALFNTIDDPEINNKNFKKIEDNYYQEGEGLKKRYFSVNSLNDFTKNLFEPVIADNKGKTYKDNIQCLIRLVAFKKISNIYYEKPKRN